MKRAWIAIALVLAGCTQDHAVLEIVTGVTDCATAFAAPSGSSCTFSGVCKRASEVDPACCAETAYCTPRGLVVDRSCNPDCSTCADDIGCVFGAAICAAGVCTPCPSTILCAPCPSGWEPLRRNGCATCDCAPPSQCDPAMAPCDDPADTCYLGERCTAGCAPGAACCANACAAPGCPAPAPLGCLVACSDPGCTLCATEDCDCVDDAWQCVERCVDDTGVTSSCIAP